MPDNNGLQTFKALVKLSDWLNVWLCGCHIRVEIGFQNVWLAKALMSSYIISKILSFFLNPCHTKSVQYIGLKFHGTVNCAVPFQYSCFCSSIRNCIAYSNEKNSLNKDSPIEWQLCY